MYSCLKVHTMWKNNDKDERLNDEQEYEYNFSGQFPKYNSVDHGRGSTLQPPHSLAQHTLL